MLIVRVSEVLNIQKDASQKTAFDMFSFPFLGNKIAFCFKHCKNKDSCEKNYSLEKVNYEELKLIPLCKWWKLFTNAFPGRTSKKHLYATIVPDFFRHFPPMFYETSIRLWTEQENYNKSAMNYMNGNYFFKHSLFLETNNSHLFPIGNLILAIAPTSPSFLPPLSSLPSPFFLIFFPCCGSPNPLGFHGRTNGAECSNHISVIASR